MIVWLGVDSKLLTIFLQNFESLSPLLCSFQCSCSEIKILCQMLIRPPLNIWGKRTKLNLVLAVVKRAVLLRHSLSKQGDCQACLGLRGSTEFREWWTLTGFSGLPSAESQFLGCFYWSESIPNGPVVRSEQLMLIGWFAKACSSVGVAFDWVKRV